MADPDVKVIEAEVVFKESTRSIIVTDSNGSKDSLDTVSPGGKEGR